MFGHVPPSKARCSGAGQVADDHRVEPGRLGSVLPGALVVAHTGQIREILRNTRTPSSGQVCRFRGLRVTPAMEAGVANHVWSIEEIVGLLG